MATPTGATHSLTATVQAAQVPSALSDWFCLLCVCDMGLSINTAGQSFVAGLEADLSDLEVCLADGETPTPWRRAEPALFSQTVGAEKLWLRVKVPAILSSADTVVMAYRGCTAPVGENSGAGVLGAGDVLYLPGHSSGTSVPDLGGALNATRNSAVTDAAGHVGTGQYSATLIHGLSVPAAEALSPGVNLTVSMWLKHPVLNFQPYEYFFNHKSIWNGAGFSAYTEGSRRFFWRGGSGTTAVWNLSPALDDGAWHHVVFTAAGTSGILYTDGVSRGTKTIIAASAITQALDVGNERGGYGMLGTIDGFRFVGRALGPNEVLADYRMTSAPASWCVVEAEDSMAGVGYRPWLLSGGRLR